VTVGAALRAGTGRLRAASESARADASRILAGLLDRDGAWLLAHDGEPLAAETRQRFERALERRATGEPVAYITGSAGFYGRRFAVTPAVLVPRPETELAVDLALEHLRAVARPVVCDVGTGSGVLAITLACELPESRSIAIDVSVAALEVARANAVACGVAGRVEFRAGDLLEPAADRAPFDCLVANLPYVPSGELAAAPDPTSFEPRLALDGGPDGLALYRRLLGRAPGLLRTGAAVVLEAGPGTARALAALAEEAFGPAARVVVHRDYGGRERTVVATLV